MRVCSAWTQGITLAQWARLSQTSYSFQDGAGPIQGDESRADWNRVNDASAVERGGVGRRFGDWKKWESCRLTENKDRNSTPNYGIEKSQN